MIGQPHRLEDAIDRACSSGPRGGAEQRRERRARRLQRQQDVVLDRVAFEHRRLLEFPADAEFRDRRLVELRQIVRAGEIDVAFVGPGLAGDHIHHGRLAGAVRADDGAHLAGLQRQRQSAQRLVAVERDVDRRRGRAASW